MSESPTTTNREAVLTAVAAYPGSTALEIAALTGRPKQYNLAPENNPAPVKRTKTAWDPARVARAWETVLGLKLSPADVRLALDIAERASRRNK